MAKASNSRKPARIKRKAQTAAKRATRQSGAARARKVTLKPRTGLPARRPTPQRARRTAEKHDRTVGSADVRTDAHANGNGHGNGMTVASGAAKSPIVEPVRVPPPLPAPIASFTF